MKRSRLRKAGSKKKISRLPRKVSFTWKNNTGWKWEATEYQGHGIFFGKVTSPIVPEGEYGTWYLWEIEKDGKAYLVEGDKELLAKIKEKSGKTMERQQKIMGTLFGD